MAKAKIGPMNRVHRPHLTPDEQALAAQHRPQEACCQDTEWLMEAQTPGADLQFYCSNCGRYRSMPQA